MKFSLQGLVFFHTCLPREQEEVAFLSPRRHLDGYNLLMPSINSNPRIQKLAHSNRHHPTEIESKLWARLRGHQVGGVHFRWQYPIGKYIVDFCAPKKKLVIELDGSQHLDHEGEDSVRTSFLVSRGYRVLRFWNSDVTNDIDGVIVTILHSLSE